MTNAQTLLLSTGFLTRKQKIVFMISTFKEDKWTQTPSHSRELQQRQSKRPETLPGMQPTPSIDNSDSTVQTIHSQENGDITMSAAYLFTRD